MEENEITVKIKLSTSVPINQDFYLDIINGLSDRYVPCNEMYLNGELVFDYTQGFVKKKGEQ